MIERIESLRTELTKERAKEVNLLELRYRRQLDRLDELIRSLRTTTGPG
jgi:hypothetical protein